MDRLNIAFGLVGIASLVFSIYAHFNTKSKKVIEAAKTAMHKERIRNAHYALRGIMHSVDAIVQIPKQGEASVEQLQHLARVVRADVYLLAQQLEMEEKKLDGWQFGKMIESTSGDTITDLEKRDDHL